jgi:hypothetical protein
MITLPNSFVIPTAAGTSETDNAVEMSRFTLDVLNKIIQAVFVYGNYSSTTSAFTPSTVLPSTTVQINMATGQVLVNGTVCAVTFPSVPTVEGSIHSAEEVIEQWLVTNNFQQGIVS